MIPRLLLAIIMVVSGDSLAAESAVKSTPATTKDAVAVNEKLWASFEPPADDIFDWIQLESDEWLKGEIIALYNFVLEFDSDELGVLKIDWDDVRRLRSAEHISLQVESRDVSQEPFVDTGKLVIDKNRGYLIRNGKTTLYRRQRIISIAEAADNELGLWVGDISVGANINAGNSELIDTVIGFSAIRRSAETRFSLNYSGNFSRVGDIETVNNHRLKSDFDVYQNANLFWRVYDAEYYRDTFKNIDWQFSLGTSFGYKLIRKSKTDWEITGGIGDLRTRYVSVEAGEAIDNTSPFITMGTIFDTELTNWMDFLVDYSFQLVEEESGRYIHYFITTVSTEFIGDLDLDVSFVWERVEEPRPDEFGNVPAKDDYQLIFRVSYGF
jgi:hypothetical protein